MTEINDLPERVADSAEVPVTPYMRVRARLNGLTGKPAESATQGYPRSGTPTIMALDLGTTTGWAIRFLGLTTSGTMSFKPGRFEGGGMRFLRFAQWLHTPDCFPSPMYVYFEEVRRHRGVDAAHAYGGFLAQLTAWCEQHSVPYRGVPVATIKRFATGKGNADKAAMIQAMRQRGHAPVDDNEADALALLHWVIAQEGK
ncbi:crossover junction endodeoxyribonuclease RuvC [Lysobacter enzymogenes]|uniref:crossover junction endodeoxyribonuclease RuvC n=1 Tax=Lysobacter enzymogenes TaxID=69 RepID=UPI0020289BC2|nr:hypothetical protein [Lysobacter enzymogenes]